MAIDVSGVITGSAVTGLTSPTYTFSADTPPDINAKQWAVTALGGTQTGVFSHSPDTPFTFTVKRPRVLKTPGAKNAITGLYANVGINEYVLLTRKSVMVQSGQYGVLSVDIRVRVPAGAASYDSANVKAASSAVGGIVAAKIQGLVDTVLTGIL